MLEWPPDDRDLPDGGVQDVFGNFDLGELRANMADARDEDLKVRLRKCSKFMAQPGLRNSLWHIGCTSAPMAGLALQILKGDTASEFMSYRKTQAGCSGDPSGRICASDEARHEAAETAAQTCAETACCTKGLGPSCYKCEAAGLEAHQGETTTRYREGVRQSPGLPRR